MHAFYAGNRVHGTPPHELERKLGGADRIQPRLFWSPPIQRGGERAGAGRPHGSVSASPVFRQALLDAINELEADGTPLLTMLESQLKSAPLATLKALAAFGVRETLADARIEPSLFERLGTVEKEWRAIHTHSE